MSSRKQFEKWGAVALAGLCLFLVIRLASEIWGNPAPGADPDETLSQPAPSRFAPASNAQSKQGKAVAGSDPSLQLQPLKDMATTPLPEISRDPFDYGAPPITPAQRAAQAARSAAVMAAAPPRPNIPFRAIGYSENANSGPEAFLADADQVYIVHDGDVISHRYKVVRITPALVEVKDGTSGETAQLPIPQVQ